MDALVSPSFFVSNIHMWFKSLSPIHSHAIMLGDRRSGIPVQTDQVVMSRQSLFWRFRWLRGRTELPRQSQATQQDRLVPGKDEQDPNKSFLPASGNSRPRQTHMRGPWRPAWSNAVLQIKCLFSDLISGSQDIAKVSSMFLSLSVKGFI